MVCADCFLVVSLSFLWGGSFKIQFSNIAIVQTVWKTQLLTKIWVKGQCETNLTQVVRRHWQKVVDSHRCERLLSVHLLSACRQACYWLGCGLPGSFDPYRCLWMTAPK